MNRLKKHEFECEHKSSYGIESRNDITHIHLKEVNKVYECHLLHDKINPLKCAKNLSSHFSTILHGCINTRQGRSKYENFRIILDSGCNSKISTGRIVEKYTLKKMLGCSSTRRPETSLQIIRLKYILPYPHLTQQI